MTMATIAPKDVREIIARYQLADGYDIVLDIEKSKGPWLHDSVRDKPFLDCFTCFASWPLGYNHPGLNDPAFEQELLRAAKCNPSNADLYSLEMAAFVESFATHASPEGFDHHFWIAGGSLAVENAIKAAFAATSVHTVVQFAYPDTRLMQGSTKWALSLLLGPAYSRGLRTP